MKSSRSSRVTQLLEKYEPSDREATEKLFVDIYTELRTIAAGYLRRERKDHTLRPTALVHEVYLKLVDQTRVVAKPGPFFGHRRASHAPDSRG